MAQNHGTNPVGCPFIKKVHDPSWECPIQTSTQPVLPSNTSGTEFGKMVSLIVAEKDAALNIAAYRGDATTNFRLAARNIHLTTRAHYKEMMTNVGANVFPLMIFADADDGVPGGLGGMITIYFKDYTIHRVVPTPPTYELLKNLSHMVIGVFTMVSPWFNCPKGLELTHLQTYLAQVIAAKHAGELDGVKIDDTLKKRALDMFAIVSKYLEEWIDAKSCSTADFQKFAEEMNKYIPNNIIEAATIQADALYPALKKIRKDMGELWKHMYVVIPTVWPVSALNPRVEVISKLMDADQVNTKVFLLDNLHSVAEYRETLGRIIGDRASANLIFGTKNLEREKMLYSLSTRQDLMANASHDAVEEIHKKHSTPEGTLKH